MSETVIKEAFQFTLGNNGMMAWQRNGLRTRGSDSNERKINNSVTIEQTDTFRIYRFEIKQN